MRETQQQQQQRQRQNRRTMTTLGIFLLLVACSNAFQPHQTHHTTSLTFEGRQQHHHHAFLHLDRNVQRTTTSSKSSFLTTLLMRKTSINDDTSSTKKKKKINSGDLSAVSIADGEWGLQQEEEEATKLLEDIINTNNSNQQEQQQKVILNNDFIQTTIIPIISTSLLITANTIGAGMLVIPEIVSKPGMFISTFVFLGCFLLNLISGFIIAEVAITQKETSTNPNDDVPSSFKEFAQVNLQSTSIANIIASISIFVNALVLAFNTIKIGNFGSSLLQSIGGAGQESLLQNIFASSGLPIDNILSIGWALGCIGIIGTQTLATLSTMSSFLVTGLFISFAGLVLPGLTHLQVDPITLITSSIPSVSSSTIADNNNIIDIISNTIEIIPILIMSLVYQNIVPTVTKILNYDRIKVGISIFLGSFIPLLMYMAYTFVVVGGGISTAATAAGASASGILMTIFTLATIGGSSIGCVMSLAEEIDTFFSTTTSNDEQQQQEVTTTTTTSKQNDKYSFPSILTSVGISSALATYFITTNGDINSVLGLAGSFGSPLLYGILPVVMAFTQSKQKEQQQSEQQQLQQFEEFVSSFTNTNNIKQQQEPEKQKQLLNNLIPGGITSLGLLGTLSTGLVGSEVMSGINGLF